MTTSFRIPAVVALTPDSWGPPPVEVDNPNAAPAAVTGNLQKFASLPYAPFGRSDRLGRAADFTQGGGGGYYGGGGGYGYGGGGGGGPGGGGGGGRGGGGRGGGGGDRPYQPRGGYQQQQAAAAAAMAATAAAEKEEAFQLVDTAKTATTKRFVNPASKRRQHSQRLRQVNARRQASTGGAGSAPVMDKMMMTRRGGGGGGPFGGRGGAHGGRGGGGRGFGAGRGGYGNRVDRQPSVAVQNDWAPVEEIDLGKINKNLHTSTTVPTPEDVLWCGFLDAYNDQFDKVTARQPVTLKRVETKEFYPVTTTDDPVLEKLAIDGEGQVFITDTILAHLMTCTRSVFPWDVVVQKLPNGALFFDKRDNSQFDFLTVYETAYNPPGEDDEINSPERLALEATMVCQNFSQQIVRKTGRKEMDLPNPFFDEDDHDDGMEPASVAYRYRKFPIDDATTVVCRTELHGLVKKTQTMTAFALNEYLPTTSNPNAVAWRDKIDSQRGAVLATELKNNSFKLAKWTAQSILAGADQMKIGFVSRVAPKNAYEHQILATQFYRPKDLATQITLAEAQMWALFRYFVALFQKQEEGKYVIMRDPNHALLKIYRVPPNTFEDDE